MSTSHDRTTDGSRSRPRHVASAAAGRLRGSGKHRRLSFVVIFLVVAATAAISPATAAAADTPAREAQGRVFGPLGHIISPVERIVGSEGPQPTPELDSSAPIVRIGHARAQAASLGPNYAHLAALGEASFKELTSDEPQLGRVLTLVQDMVAEAQSAPAPDRQTSGVLAEIRGDLTAAAEGLVTGHIAAARRAGVDPAIVDDAQASVERGLAAIVAGDDAAGVASFGQAFDKVAPTLRFDIDTFYDNLVDTFGDQAIGVQFTLLKGGAFYKKYENGDARKPIENGGEVDMTFKKRQIIASVSKMITATAVLDMLEKLEKDPLTTKISEYLPPFFTMGPGVDDLTFADLLNHRSGLNNNTSACCPGWDATKAYVAVGVTPLADPNDASKQIYTYLNGNYSLLAMLLPPMWAETVNTNLDAIDANETLAKLYYPAFYTGIVNQFVLKPSGIAWAGCAADAVSPTLFYDFNAPASMPGNSASLSGPACGYGGWNLSTFELGAFMAHLRYEDNLLHPDTRDLMREEFLGWMDASWGWVPGTYGTYYSHGGDFGTRGGMDACIMSFPQGAQVALLTNSVNGNYGGYQCSAIAADYDNAWVKN